MLSIVQLQICLAERFGDGDASQIGLDLDEVIYFVFFPVSY